MTKLLATTAAILIASPAAAQDFSRLYQHNRVRTPEGAALRSDLSDFETACGSRISGSPLQARQIQEQGYNVHIADGTILYMFYPGAMFLGKNLYRLEAFYGEVNAYWGSVLLRQRSDFDAVAQAFGRTEGWARRTLDGDDQSRSFPSAGILAAQDGRVVEEFRAPDGRRAIALYETIEEDDSGWIALFRCAPSAFE